METVKLKSQKHLTLFVTYFIICYVLPSCSVILYQQLGYINNVSETYYVSF